MGDLNERIEAAFRDHGADGLSVWRKPDGQWTAAAHSAKTNWSRQATAGSPLAALQALYDAEPETAPAGPSLGALG